MHMTKVCIPFHLSENGREGSLHEDFSELGSLKDPWAFLTRLKLIFFTKALLKNFIIGSISMNYTFFSKHFPTKSDGVSL